jgi:hypothetical protein
MNFTEVLSLLIISAVVTVTVPILAFNGRPKGFTRLNWVGISVGMALSAAIFLFIAQNNVPSLPPYELMKVPALVAQLEHEYNQQRLLAFTFGILGVLCCSLAVGSVFGIFFHRPKHD